jgi:hypothetical protein
LVIDRAGDPSHVCQAARRDQISVLTETRMSEQAGFHVFAPFEIKRGIQRRREHGKHIPVFLSDISEKPAPCILKPDICRRLPPVRIAKLRLFVSERPQDRSADCTI